jgi:hypothetical protein
MKEVKSWRNQIINIDLGEFTRIVYEAGITKGKLESAEARLNRVKK